MSNSDSSSSTSAPSKDKQDKDKQYIIYYDIEQRDSIGSTFIALIIIFWIVAGIAAHLTSLACIGGSGFWQNIWALLIAILLGPFYWLYYYFMKDKGYCYYSKS
jgi:hypothetical protein